MTILKGSITTTNLDVDNAIEFLATVQRKERAESYRQKDYLCLKRKIVHSNRMSYDDEVVRSVCSYLNHNLQKHRHWEMSMEGRVQVGQWFFKSTFPYDL
jgi:hypothetical protein